MEIRPVPFAPEYGVTRDGRVFRIAPWPRMPHAIVLPFEMTLRLDSDGYVITGRTLKVHRAVAAAFLPPPERPEQVEVCHNNGIRSDNVDTNLRWGTRGENYVDMTVHGTQQIGSGHSQAKLDEELVREARRRAASGEPHSSIAEDMPVDRSVLSRAIRGDTWAHV